VSGNRDRIDTLIEGAGLGVLGQIAEARAPRILKGPAAMIGDAAYAAADLATTGRISAGTIAGAATNAALMVGARMVPGVGWAMLAYTAADVGCRAVLGKPFGETWVGRPIDWAAGQAGRGLIGLATAATDAVGWSSGSDFLNNTLRPWAFGTKSGDEGFVRGPETVMNADDWTHHRPTRMPSGTLDATDLPGIEPDPDDIAKRRVQVLETDTRAIAAEELAADLGMEGGVGRAELLKAALDMLDGDTDAEPRRQPIRQEERGLGE
jgi:hypothetical protein